ncbi:MAG: hypothetical protein COB23_09750 [Methylophaga sp.]|nr:MAG: hypothetical protein COB23_09750 [Methylophaga sp.]
MTVMDIALRFFDLCLFKAGPEDVPASSWLMKITLVIYFILGIAIGRIDSTWNASLFISLADLLVMMLAINVLLRFRGFQARYQQTVTAMAGAGCCLGIIGFPVLVLFYQVGEQARFSSIAMLLMVGLMFWSLMVTAHILRKSLEIKPGTAAAITIAYTVLSLLVAGLALSGVT